MTPVTINIENEKKAKEIAANLEKLGNFLTPGNLEFLASLTSGSKDMVNLKLNLGRGGIKKQLG